MKKRMMANNHCSAGDDHWTHAHDRHRRHAHFLDFENYPLPFKPYGLGQRMAPAGPVSCTDSPGFCSKEALFRLLFLAYGVTAARKRGGIPLLQRTVPSAGGLYPCHLYLGIPGGNSPLETGVYYYDPLAGNLVQLRTGIDPCPGASEDILFMITASFYNSAWKYRGRAYRYMLLDGGHLAENLCQVLGDHGIAADLTSAFNDKKAGALLGLPPDKEAVLACVSTGWNRNVPEFLSRIEQRTRPCSLEPDTRPAEHQYMTAYTILPEAYASGADVTDKGSDTRMRVTDSDPVVRNQNKFSSYRFLRLGMICQNMELLADGFYLFDRAAPKIRLMRKGAFAHSLAAACLDQAWIGRAAVTFLFLSDLDELERIFGPRGYRYMMLSAGRIAQRIYLGAESIGLGCCGIGAIYDQEAKALLGLRKNSALVYAVSAGPLTNRAGHGN